MTKTNPFFPKGDVREDFRASSYAINNILDGKINSTGIVTLRANQTTTTINDGSCGEDSVILFMPKTSNASAALASMYVSSTEKQSFTVTHASNSQTDKTFGYAIFG